MHCWQGQQCQHGGHNQAAWDGDDPSSPQHAAQRGSHLSPEYLEMASSPLAPTVMTLTARAGACSGEAGAQADKNRNNQTKAATKKLVFHAESEKHGRPATIF